MSNGLPFSGSLPGRVVPRSLSVLCMLFLVGCATPDRRSPGVGEYHPGHYAAFQLGESLESMRAFADGGVRGASKRYRWRELESEPGSYDFSEIRDDLDYLAGMGKYLVVFVMDKTFSSLPAVPEYMEAYGFAAADGITPARWVPYYAERYTALALAIAREFGDHPAFEGIAMQESSLEITPEGYERFGYTPEAYRDALISIITGIQAGMPRGHMFWYSNFLPDGDKYLYDIADAMKGTGALMGGPDITPHRRWLSRISYPMYEKYARSIPLFCSAQEDSYRHHTNDIRVEEIEPLPPEGYMTMEDIFLFARDELRVSYVFWDYEYGAAEEGGWTFDDALEVIGRYRDFGE